MTEIHCECYFCKYNKDGKCIRNSIDITMFGSCQSEENAE